MSRRGKYALMITLLALSATLTGCGDGQTKEAVATVEGEAPEEVASEADATETEVAETVDSEIDDQYLSETINGQVSKLNGSEITVAVGTISSFEGAIESKGEAPTGEVPEGEAPTGDKPAGEAPTGGKPVGEMPEGEAPIGDKLTGEAPTGDMPAGGGTMPSTIFTAGEETYTFIVEDEAMIYLEQDAAEAQGTLADIQEGSILGIDVDAEGKISKIIILNAISSSEMEKGGGEK